MGEFRKKFLFGAGSLYALDPAAAVPNPRRFGTLQEGTIEFSFTKKELQGQNSFPDATGRAEGKITGKAKAAAINAALIGEMFFGIPPVAGQVVPVQGEDGLIPAKTAFTITVANALAFMLNLGVYFKATGVYLDRVAETPATGQYTLDDTPGSPTLGTYTFAEADAGKAVKFDYLYSDEEKGVTINISNEPMGEGPTFMAILNLGFKTTDAVLILNKCTSNKLSIATKKGDFTIPEFDFEAQADDADEIGLISLSK